MTLAAYEPCPECEDGHLVTDKDDDGYPFLRCSNRDCDFTCDANT